MAKKTGGLKAFRRACRFLWPQRRRLAVAVVCSFALAVSFAASLGVLVPVLQIFVTKQGPRASLFEIAAARSLGVQIQPYGLQRDHPLDIDFSAAWVVVRLEERSSFQTHDVGIGDVILPPEPSPTSGAFLEQLAARGASVEVRVYSQDGVVRPLTLQPLELDSFNEAITALARRAGGWLPVDTAPDARRKTLMTVFAAIFVLVLFSAVCRFIAEYMVIISSNRAVMDLRRHMYRTVMYLPMSWFGRHLSETMSRVVTDFRDVERGYRALFGKLTTEPISVVVMLVFAVTIDARITGFALTAGILGGGIVWVIGRKIRKANRRLLAGYAQLMGVLNATLLGMRVVRAHNNETFERRRMWQADRLLLKNQLKIGRWGALTGPALEVMGVTVIMIGILVMADHVFTNDMKPERFMILIGALVKIFDSIRKMSAVFPRLARADGAAQRVFEMMDSPIEKPVQQAPALRALAETIEFRDVTFSYPESGRPALRNINLKIERGQRVALVGPNGSGKTTMMSLLCRFFQPDSGQILFDGRDIHAHSIESLRSQISLVTQDAVVFAATVTDNIAYGILQPDREAVTTAARRAYAHEFVTDLPKGYDTILGEFGATLSGGQRQRLALARSIFRDAPIFIFDEATSQVDVDSEQKIQEATRQFMTDRTSFVIAHRIATITDADLIAVFDDGRLVATGKHADLLRSCELYATLYRSHTAS